MLTRGYVLPDGTGRVWVNGEPVDFTVEKSTTLSTLITRIQALGHNVPTAGSWTLRGDDANYGWCIVGEAVNPTA
jgi:hypothetical protein